MEIKSKKKKAVLKIEQPIAKPSVEKVLPPQPILIPKEEESISKANSSKVNVRKASAMSRTRNQRFTSVFSTLEQNPEFKGSLGQIADKVIHRGEVISDLKKRRNGIARPQTAIYPRVKDGFKTYDRLIEVQKPEPKQPIIELDLLSEHT